MTVTDSRREAAWTVGRRTRDPVDATGGERAPAKFVARSDHHSRLRRVEFEYVHRCAGSQSESLALTDSQPVDTAMAANDLASRVDNFAGAVLIGEPPVDKTGGVAVRNEADLVAVRLVGDREAEPAGDVAHFGLPQMPDGKQRMSELILRQREEKIRLVLVAVGASQEPVPAEFLVVRHSRVVARRDSTRLKT